MNKNDRNKYRKLSLSRGLIAIVVTCWFLPLMFLIIMLSYYTSGNVENQFKSAISSNVINTAYLCRHAIGMAIDSSRSANYDGIIYDAYSNYKQDGDYNLLYTEIDSYLQHKYRFDSNISASVLFLTENQDDIFYTINSSTYLPYNHIMEYKQYIHEYAVKTSETLGTGIDFFAAGKSIYMIRNIVDNSFNPYAVLIFKLNTENIFGYFDDILWNKGVSIYIDDAVISYNLNGNSLPKPVKSEIEDGNFVVIESDGTALIQGRADIYAIDLLYSIVIDKNAMTEKFAYIIRVFYIFILLLIPLFVLIVIYVYRNIFNPIKFICDAAIEIQAGKLGKCIDYEVTNKEFYNLIETFNKMSTRLKQQFDHIYSEEIALRDAKIMALQLQINPHFLNNTLEIINWESRLGNNEKASRMIEALSTLLDAAMDRKKHPTIPLHTELMYLDAYLYIITERFGKRLIVNKQIDSELLQNKIPRLIMQPVIENAVEHGAEKTQKGEININVYKQKYDINNTYDTKERGDYMILEVQNNSPLYDKDKERINDLLNLDNGELKSGKSAHLGIRNVNMRLKFIYGEAAQLVITGDENKTISKIMIPL